MENSKIEWTDHTFNPWVGCTKISPACKNCYAEAWDDRYNKGSHWGPNGTRQLTSDANWKKPWKWNREAQKEGVRKRVLCASLSDVFEDHPMIQPAWREVLFDMIEQTPWLDWMLLTKRPENVEGMVPKYWLGSITIHGQVDKNMSEEGKTALGRLAQMAYETHTGKKIGWPKNCWIGTTVENQEEADKRIPELLKIPASVRFLSCEPLLGPVDLRKVSFSSVSGGIDFIVDALKGTLVSEGDINSIDLVIVGGESGPNARPMHLRWVKDLRDQCVDAGVPFFFKQWGEWMHIDQMNEEQLDSFNIDDMWDKDKVILTDGDHKANRSDWIIKGVKGECYPCKPDIFEMTYEKVDE